MSRRKKCSRISTAVTFKLENCQSRLLRRPIAYSKTKVMGQGKINNLVDCIVVQSIPSN